MMLDTHSKEYLCARFIQIVNAVCGYDYFHFTNADLLFDGNDHHESLEIKSGSLDVLFADHHLANNMLTAFGPLSFYELPNFDINLDHRSYIIATEIKDHVLSMVIHEFDGAARDEEWELFRLINEVVDSNFLDSKSEDEADIDMLSYFKDNTEIEYVSLNELNARFTQLKSFNSKSGKLQVYKNEDLFILATSLKVALVEFQRIALVTVDELVMISLYNQFDKRQLIIFSFGIIVIESASFGSRC